MSRRSYKTINLPRAVVAWIDSVVGSRESKPLGIESRDEFVRIAVVVLGLALQTPSGPAPIEQVRQMVQALRDHNTVPPLPDSPGALA